MLHPFRILALSMAAAGLAPAAGAQPRFDFDATPGRLSKDVRPLLQQLALDVDPDAERFEGRSTITLRLRRPQDSLLLHAHKLQPAASDWVGADGRPRALALQADEAAQTWRLTPADGRPLPRGQGRLQMRWSGPVQATGNGLYRAAYGPPGAQRHILATQMEAVSARQVFPTFDEPAFRIAFELSVRAPAGWQVLSNMPERRPSPAAGRILHRFERTPAMPSYLVALAVGHFDALPGRAAGVPLRILTVPGRQAQGAYALQVTQQLLPYYTQYFGQPFALPKLDQLAVPSTRNGAMEDWGLISYADSLLLFDPATGNTERQRWVFSLIAHEVAHQWFGNLVTAASWEEIWLNEAFAEWMAEKASHRFNPQWQLPLRRRAEIDRTMERDGGTATRAIRSGAVAEASVFDVFDNITYNKGGAVLAMLEAWLGEDRFRAGLRAYMKAQRLSNASAGDLWFHLGRAAGRDVAAVAASWTDQPGFPLIGVESRCEQGQTQLVLTQQPYGPHGRSWQVPLTLLHDGRPHTLLLGEPRQALALPGCPALPTLVNASGIGYYRVAYAEPQRAALAAAFAALPAPAQVMLLSDRLALAQSERLPFAEWLALLAQLPATQGAGRPALLTQAVSGLRSLRAALVDSPAAAPLDAAARALLTPELRALGWTARAGEDSEAEALRATLIGALALHGDADTIARAGALFDDDEAGRAALPAAIRAAVIEAAGRSADATRYAALQRRLLAATSEDDRWTHAAALAAAREPALLQQTLALTLDQRLPPNIATQLPALLSNEGPPEFRETVYAHVLQHWPALAQRAGDMNGANGRLLPNAAAAFNTAAAAERLLADQQRLAGDPGRAGAERVAARIRQRAALREREGERLVAPLQALAQQLSPPR